jgi:hypothetical protein
MATMKGAVTTLAFRVVPREDNMFSSEMILMRGGNLVEKKTGEPTLLGHAIGQAQEILAHYAVSEKEVSPESFFTDVVVL